MTDTIGERRHLRDGTSTDDPRLDRIAELDPRSRSFPVTASLPAAPTLRDHVWRLERRLMGNQGRDGACVEFGLSHVLAAMPITQALRVLQAVRARHLIYWPAQGQRTPWLPAGWTGDPWPGGSYPGASPVYEGTSELTGMKVAQQLGFIGGYEWAFRFDDAVAGVLHVGAANLALGWTQGMMDARPDGLIEDTGNVVGGHDVAWIGCLFGKRMRSDGRGGPRRDVAVIAQSWGLGYGDRGRVYVPLEHLERRLADDGTCAFVNGEKKVSEVPPA